ncbi:LysR family transcriptional regulator [Rhizobium leguminosarum]|uniref:LysR family transcriptional regulator n=1 Tax=Rhizobium leguminosarum TaxID=384 RepID=UPI003F972FDA
MKTEGVDAGLLETSALQAFIEVFEAGSFKAAAQSLNRSPAALSMQIKRLETQLSAVLFKRNSRSVALSPEGEKLLPYARTMIALSNEVASKLIAPESRGTVLLGAPFDIGERRLPRLLRQLANRYPEIDVNIVIDESRNLLHRYNRGEVDITLFNCSTEFGRDLGRVIATERLVWAGASKGSAYKRDPLPLAVFEHGCLWRSQALKQLQDSGRKFRIACNSLRGMAQKVAVTSDLAIAALPEFYLNDGMIELGSEDGLGELPRYQIRMVSAESPSMHVGYVSDFIRRFWTNRHP